MTDSQRARQGYATSNLESARIVAADPAKYQGVLQTWARLVIENSVRRVEGPLFPKEAA